MLMTPVTPFAPDSLLASRYEDLSKLFMSAFLEEMTISTGIISPWL